MYTGSHGELDFEADFINELKKAGWEKDVIYNPTVEDLTDNWENIIFERNRARLSNTPLSDNEMQQVLDRVKQEADVPWKANLFLRTADRGIAIDRDADSDDMAHAGKTVYINLFQPAEIAGGTSRYQIVEQPIIETNQKNPDRRGDLLLMIDGIPVVEIELKASGHSVVEAENQVRKYMMEGAYTGILSFVQVFFCITPEDAVYFANPGDYHKINPAYIFHWADRDNKEITDWKELITGENHLLSVPETHRLISYYTVADRGDNILKVVRSYQFNAIHAILESTHKHIWGDHDQKGGYVWNTTGSGKTLTSYLSGEMIHDFGMADKVVFVVDRIALDSQALLDYKNIAREEDEVSQTTNTQQLFRMLKSKDNYGIILTSIQKLANIAKSEKISDQDKQIVAAKRIVFIIDEAHRSQFGTMHRAVKDLFYNALFFGFTGTPIMNENRRAGEQTTDGVFGQCLAVYTLADGIRDGNVLGFWPDYVSTFKDNDVKKQVAMHEAKVTDGNIPKPGTKQYEIYRSIMKLPMAGYTDDKTGQYVKGIEDYLSDKDYNTKNHRTAVIDDIAEKFEDTSRGESGTIFSALLATSSIPEAYQYWKLIRQKHPEWNVTAIFDPQANQDKADTGDKESWLTEIADDFYMRFEGRHFNRKSDSNFAIYKDNVTKRLARVSPFQNPPEDKTFDIVIVVDQLLTGFNSRTLNCVYLDKVMESDNLIQAISRTNRTYDITEKPAGVIRFYRKPNTMANNLDEALKLYCRGDIVNVQTDDLKTNLAHMNKVFSVIKEVFSHDNQFTKDFQCLPSSGADREQFRKSYIELRTLMSTVMMQGFHWSNLANAGMIDFDKETYDILTMRYNDLSTHTKHGRGDNRSAYDFMKHLSDHEGDRITAEYLESRFGKLTYSMLHPETTSDDTDALCSELSRHVGILPETLQKYARLVLDDIRSHRLLPDPNVSFLEYIQKYRSAYIRSNIEEAAKKFGVNASLFADLYERCAGSDVRSSKELDELEHTSTEPFSVRRHLYNDLADYILNCEAELK